MRKIFTLSISAVMVAFSLSGCGNKRNREVRRIEPGAEPVAEALSDTKSQTDAEQQNRQSDNSPSRLKVTNIKDIPNTLEPMGKNTYVARNLFDRNPNTAWSITLGWFEPYDGLREGPRMTVNAQKLDYIRIMNGYGKSSKAFHNNIRAAWIIIYRVNGSGYPDVSDIIYEGPLKDTMSYQRLEVSDSYDNSKPTREVRIGFSPDDSDYYYGTTYDDLTISELEFYGRPL